VTCLAIKGKSTMFFVNCFLASYQLYALKKKKKNEELRKLEKKGRKFEERM
jgi:hypothetical protein